MEMIQLPQSILGGLKMSKAKLKKHTLLLFSGDFERLGDLHQDVKPSVVLRTLLHNHIKRVMEASPTPELEMEG